MTSALMKWDPFRMLDMFDGAFARPAFAGRAYHDPEIRETDEAFTITVDMPGMEVAVDLDGDVLTLAGHRQGGDRKHSYTVPRFVDKERISATYTRGVLQVTLPKKEEAKKAEPRSIKVEVT